MPTDGFNKSTLSCKFHTAVYVSIPRTVCQLSSCQLKKNKKKQKRVTECTILILLQVVAHYRDDEYR